MPQRRIALWAPLAIVAAAVALLAVATTGGHVTHGQTDATPTPAVSAVTGSGDAAVTAPAGPEQPIDNDAAVRLVLPASIQNSAQLPVTKWARADLYGTSSGHLIFIATVFPYTESDGSASYRLITNELQWDGAAWTPALPNYTGITLDGDNLWLAQNLTDITAYPVPPASGYTGFYATLSAQGPYSGAVARAETVGALYALTLNESWSRVQHLQDVDTSNAGYTTTHTEDVAWSFQPVNDATGIVANVTDTDEIALTGAADPSLPQPGTTQTASTETYLLSSDGTFVALSPGGMSAQPAVPSAATAAPTAPAATTPAPAVSATLIPVQLTTATATATPARAATACAAPGILVPRGIAAPPTCGPTPAATVPQGTPIPQSTATPNGTAAG